MSEIRTENIPLHRVTYGHIIRHDGENKIVELWVSEVNGER